MKFDAKGMQDFRIYINTKFDEIEKETGVKLTIASIRYDELKFSCKMVGTTEDPSKVIWYQNHYKHRMQLNDLYKTFMANGIKYTITGCKERSCKRPIIAIGNGGSYVFPVSMIRDLQETEQSKKENINIIGELTC